MLEMGSWRRSFRCARWFGGGKLAVNWFLIVFCIVIGVTRGSGQIRSPETNKTRLTKSPTGIESGALLSAAFGGRTEEVRRLLVGRPSLERRDSEGDTALILAAGSGNTEIVRLLLVHGAKVDAQRKDGATALLLAAAFSRLPIERLLLVHHADPNCLIRSSGKCALMWAAEKCYREAGALLLEAGADVNRRDYKGRTALMYAARSGSRELVDALLKRRADPRAIDDDGNTAVRYARASNNDTITAALEHAGYVQAGALTEMYKLEVGIGMDHVPDQRFTRLVREGETFSFSATDDKGIFHFASGILLPRQSLDGRYRLFMAEAHVLSRQDNLGGGSIWELDLDRTVRGGGLPTGPCWEITLSRAPADAK